MNLNKLSSLDNAKTIIIKKSFFSPGRILNQVLLDPGASLVLKYLKH